MAEEAKWYVVHTYSGYENAVAAAVMKAAENRKMQDLIQEVNIPMETVTEHTRLFYKHECVCFCWLYKYKGVDSPQNPHLLFTFCLLRRLHVC